MRGKPNVGLRVFSITLKPADRPGTLVTRVRAKCVRAAKTTALNRAGDLHDWVVTQVSEL